MSLLDVRAWMLSFYSNSFLQLWAFSVHHSSNQMLVASNSEHCTTSRGANYFNLKRGECIRAPSMRINFNILLIRQQEILLEPDIR